MTDKVDHIAWAAEAIAVYQRRRRTGDEHAIADLICDLGHLAEEQGFDFLSEVTRGVGHWYAEHHAVERDRLGPDAAVEIIISQGRNSFQDTSRLQQSVGLFQQSRGRRFEV
jgi:hypothetical protein